MKNFVRKIAGDLGNYLLSISKGIESEKKTPAFEEIFPETTELIVEKTQDTNGLEFVEGSHFKGSITPIVSLKTRARGDFYLAGLNLTDEECKKAGVRPASWGNDTRYFAEISSMESVMEKIEMIKPNIAINPNCYYTHDNKKYILGGSWS
tara:strand:- start:662 stop:1114 length:453 start_codon:yes stop_codon:yes gene_type:complete